MRTCCLIVALFVSVLRLAAADRATVVVVVGAPGEDEFATAFTQQVTTWAKVCTQAGAKPVVVGTAASGATADRDLLKQALEAEAKEGTAELWVVLIGHGTFDGKEAKFNLRGPDLAASDLAEWLKPFRRPLAIIDTASASAPFLTKLAAPGRVVVSSTRSGNEHNYARFGTYFAEAIADPKSDLDKDGQVSLLEAFLSGAQRTAEFYKTEGRLATEHAIIDDNGDGLGTPADWFRGVRATKRAKDGSSLDGVRAHQFHLVRSDAEQQLTPEARAKRDDLELKLSRLRDAKAKLPEARYYLELEKLLLELAAVYEGT
ncbi:MAG: hypothetical protein NTV51_22750 [Verrucomicrobia bacterium]|nr:hypothetical protein [Verrucomicrobiota bacterium]